MNRREIREFIIDKMIDSINETNAKNKKILLLNLKNSVRFGLLIKSSFKSVNLFNEYIKNDTKNHGKNIKILSYCKFRRIAVIIAKKNGPRPMIMFQ